MEWFGSYAYIPIEDYDDVIRVNAINRLKDNMRNDLSKVKERTWRVNTSEHTIDDHGQLQTKLEMELGLGAKVMLIAVKVKGRK